MIIKIMKGCLIIKMGFFERQYSKCYDFLKESSDYVVVVMGIMAAFFIIGFAFPVFYVEEIIKWVSIVMLEMEGLGAFGMVGFIFWNNLQAGFISILFGSLAGIFPVFSSAMNGYLIGFVSRHAVEANGIGVLWRLVPHGIFEIPAILFSMGIGLKLGVDIFTKKGRESWKKDFVEAMRFFVFVVFPLLLVAGLIEGILIWLAI